MARLHGAPDRPPVMRVYDEPDQARLAIEALLNAGIPAEAISILSESRVEAEELERATGASDDLEEATERRHPFSDAMNWLGRVEGAWRRASVACSSRGTCGRR